MTTDDTQPESSVLTHDQLIILLIDFVLAMMRSASTDKIRGLDWWPRARAALETSAAMAETYSQMVSKYGAKIEVEATKTTTSNSISLIGDSLARHAAFEAFRSLAERDALYIVAMAQVTNQERKDAAKAQKQTKKSRGDTWTDAMREEGVL